VALDVAITGPLQRRRSGMGTGSWNGHTPQAVVLVNRLGPPQVDRVAAGRAPGALTGWTAGAHVPAVQLSSLPLDEFHYMRNNEMLGVRLRPAHRRR
jgi:hypothetical protein